MGVREREREKMMRLRERKTKRERKQCFRFSVLCNKNKKKADDIIFPTRMEQWRRVLSVYRRRKRKGETKTTPLLQASSSLGLPPGTNTATLLPLSRIVSSLVSALPPDPSGADSTASSSTMFTKASNPRSVPSTSRSPLSRTHSRAPTQRSRSSEGRRWEGLAAVPAPALRGATMAILAGFFRGGGARWRGAVVGVGVEEEGKEREKGEQKKRRSPIGEEIDPPDNDSGSPPFRWTNSATLIMSRPRKISDEDLGSVWRWIEGERERER